MSILIACILGLLCGWTLAEYIDKNNSKPKH